MSPILNELISDFRCLICVYPPDSLPPLCRLPLVLQLLWPALLCQRAGLGTLNIISTGTQGRTEVMFLVIGCYFDFVLISTRNIVVDGMLSV